MLTEDDVRRLLLQRAETKNLDYKRTCNWVTAGNDEKCEIVKDILAMANTQDGGQLILGVENAAFDFVGMAENEFQSFDATRLNDFVRRYADPQLAVTLYKFTVDGLRTVVIEVPEFQEVPIVCKADANSNVDPRRIILKRGGMYVRTDRPSSELVSSAEEMRDIINRASRKKREELIRTIEALITGRPAPEPEDPGPRYDGQLREANEYFATNLPDGFFNQGHWSLIAYPMTYAEERIGDHATLADILRQSSVALRGWTFPHTDNQTAANFMKGRQSYTNWERFTEGYRAYFSGLFCWTSAYRENSIARGAKVLSFISAIYSLTEFFQFFKRYYSQFPDIADIHVAITLTDTRNRTLVSMDPRVEIGDGYVCREAEITLARNVSAAELQTEAESIPRALSRRLFQLFNWNDIEERVIASWQHKLLTRTY